MMTNESDHLSKGNLYLHDIVKAIDFLRENSDNFGFDINRITVFGQSAGGSLSSWTGALSALKGKIHRVIPSSGQLSTFFGSKNMTGTNGPSVRELASKVHCWYPDAVSINDCLISKSDEEARSMSHMNLTWRPVHDNELIFHRDPMQSWLDNSKDIDVLVGATAGDSIGFSLPFWGGESGFRYGLGEILGDFSPETFNDVGYLVDLALHYGRFWGDDKAPLDDPNATNPDPKTESFQRGLLQALQGWIFDTAVFRLAEAHANLQKNNTNNESLKRNTFIYRSDFQTAIENLGSSDLIDFDIHENLLNYCNQVNPDPYHDIGENNACGAIHGEDILYFMGHILMRSSALIKNAKTESRFELSDRMVTAWTNFAKTGDPNSNFVQFDAENPQFLSLRNAVKDRNPSSFVDVQSDVDYLNWVDTYFALLNLPAMRMKECKVEDTANKNQKKMSKRPIFHKNYRKTQNTATSFTSELVKYANSNRFEQSKIISNSNFSFYIKDDEVPACPSYRRQSNNEDCLYLNIGVPEYYLEDDEKLPLVIYLTDDDQFPISSYNSSEMANEFGAIFTIPEYRKGVLGFLANDDPKHVMNSNFGLPPDGGFFLIIKYDSYTIIRKNPQSGGI